ncbi:MAG: hypothetical protein IJ527_01725 [Prevotella sp.]|nr:hypothetical protein [Prevotella sp.]
MKKLILMLLVLTGGILQAMADTTVYLNPNANSTDLTADNAKLSLYYFKSADSSQNGWDEFTATHNGVYTATLPDGYDKIIIVRGSVAKDWDAKWNQSDDLTFNSAEPFYTVTGWTTFSTSAVHKIYVKNMQTAAAPKIHTWSGTYNSDWPGYTLQAEGDWYVFVTSDTSVNGLFTLTGDDDKSGNITFDLSAGDAYYNYYPTSHQAVSTATALAEPAKIYIRSNYASTLKINQWTSGVFVPSEAMSTETVGGYDWYVFSSYSPTIQATFRTYHNSDSDNDDCYSYTFSLASGESTYYYAKAMGPVVKLESSYYLVYSNGWNLDSDRWLDESDHSKGKETVGAIQLTLDGFEYTGTLDNTAAANLLYAIVPASMWSGTAIVGESWNPIIFPFSNVTDSKCTISNFAIDQCDVLPATWNRWYIPGVDKKFNVTFNFAEMKWTSTPFFTKTIPAAESNGSYYATFSSEYAVAVPAGLTMYWADGSQSVSTAVTMTEITNGLPADKGAFLKATSASADYDFYPATSTDDVTGNLLKPTEAFSYNSSVKQYAFAKHGTDVGFYKITGAVDLGLNKAYLELPSGGGESRISIVFDGETTDINGITIDSFNESTVNDGAIYDLQGRRVDNNYRGIVIKNGKKVVIK